MENRSTVSSIENAQADARSGIEAVSSAVVAAMAAIALGAAIILVVGFSHSDLLHAAAHDVRHATGFPCH